MVNHALIYPLASVLLGGVGMVVLVRGVFGRWFRAGGKAGRVRSCRRCRFDMSATDGHLCPECGHAARHEGEHYAGRFRWPVATLGLVLLLGAVGVGMTPGIQREGWLHLLPMRVQVRAFHLEGNSDAWWAFLDRLSGKSGQMQPRINGMRISPNLEAAGPAHVETWRDAAVSTAVWVMTRERVRPAEQLQRASSVLSGLHGRVTAEDMNRILRVHGVHHKHVRPLVARWTGEPTPEIRLARRVLLAPDSQWASSVARTVAQSTLEPEDAQALGAYLARTDAGSTPGRGSRVSSLGVQPPEAVWLAYAAEVRAGSIGSIETLADGARANAVVGALAIEHVASLPIGKTSKDHAEPLLQADLAPGLGAHLDRELLGKVLRSSSAFDAHSELVSLINRHDEGAADWYIAMVRDRDSELRDRAMANLGRVRHGRAAALCFALEEAWKDRSLSLWSRTWPLVTMRVWSEASEADIAACWAEVLDQMATGDADDMKEGVTALISHRPPPGGPALVAVGRRLLVEPDAWLVDLAGGLAAHQGQSRTLEGFVALLERRAGQRILGRDRETQEIARLAAALAERLAADHPDQQAD